MRTTSRDDIGRGMCGVSGRLSSKSKYISGLHDYNAPRRGPRSAVRGPEKKARRGRQNSSESPSWAYQDFPAADRGLRTADQVRSAM
jgi:hypothetical protein